MFAQCPKRIKKYTFSEKGNSPNWSCVYLGCTFENLAENCLTKGRLFLNSMSEIIEKTFFSKKTHQNFSDTQIAFLTTLPLYWKNAEVSPQSVRKWKKNYKIDFSSKFSIGNVESSFEKPAPNFKANQILGAQCPRLTKEYFFLLRKFLPLKVSLDS